MNIHIGGTAREDGIVFQTNTLNTLVTDNEGKISIITYEEPVITGRFIRLPFIRGILYTLLIPYQLVSRKSKEDKSDRLSIARLLAFQIFIFFLTVACLTNRGRGLGDFALFLLWWLIMLLGASVIVFGKTFLQYHGAEHKIICAHNRGLKLTLANVRKCPKWNVMCGSSFLSLVFLLIVVMQFRCWLIPLSFSLAFEMICYASERDNIISKVICVPGYLAQLFLTREPTDRQIMLGIKGISQLKKAESQLARPHNSCCRYVSSPRESLLTKTLQ